MMNNANTGAAMRFLGTDDSVTVCDCCGKIDLKSTVAIETAAGNVVHYGVVCAARALKTSAKIVKSETKIADDAKRAAAEAARRAAYEKHDAEWQAFLDARAPRSAVPADFDGKPNRLAQINYLGGFAAARAAFKATR
jgi:hypothetical protein